MSVHWVIALNRIGLAKSCCVFRDKSAVTLAIVCALPSFQVPGFPVLSRSSRPLPGADDLIPTLPFDLATPTSVKAVVGTGNTLPTSTSTNVNINIKINININNNINHNISIGIDTFGHHNYLALVSCPLPVQLIHAGPPSITTSALRFLPHVVPCSSKPTGRMLASRGKRSRYSSRPFVVSTLLIIILAACSLLAQRPTLTTRRHPAHYAPGLLARGAWEAGTDTDCAAVHLHDAADQCAFVLANCKDDEAGLISYLTFYYCTLGGARPLAFVILVGWGGLLFTTIGIAASDFFSVNLSTISSVLGLSESLAGVTFLAIGNGSPDVFSTFAAMKSNSGSMAVGELLGAAGFITAVVAGSMGVVREFEVSKRPFVRDIVFFIIAISFTMVFLADGELHLWESCLMIAFYLFYVAVVVGWHCVSARRRRHRKREATARAHIQGDLGGAANELEPYRDAPDDDDDEPAPVRGHSRAASNTVDISALERGPRIEVDGVAGPSSTGSDYDEDRDVQVAAEMANSMRISRPPWERQPTASRNPIRPSLVGALDFQSIISHLQKDRNMPMRPVYGRGHTYHDAPQQSGLVARSTFPIEDARGRSRATTSPSPMPPQARERALSSGNLPLSSESSGVPQTEHGPGSQRPGLDTRNSSSTRTVDGRLAPPTNPAIDQPSQQLHVPERSQFLQISIPSPGGGGLSGQSSPSLSAFPSLSDSPAAISPMDQGQVSNFSLPGPLDSRPPPVPRISEGRKEFKPIRWWPHRVLPPPHILFATIFPTLQGWREKNFWAKFLGLVSVPSILLLVTTLPVVDSDVQDDDSAAEAPGPLESGIIGQPEEGISEQPQAVWQEYRRRTRSMVSSRSPLSMRSSFADFHSALPPGDAVAHNARHPSISIQAPEAPQVLENPQALPQLAKPTGPAELDQTTVSMEELPLDWKRWLVALQLITGPQFLAFIVWANNTKDMEQPAKMLLRLVLYALVFSLCLLGVLLTTTTPEKKPKYHFLLCFLGFIISVAWISTIAGEVVGVLKAFGIILKISEAILGLTIFAIGNSLGDLVANYTIARVGYPVMALAACFGGPMLNILLGVGIGGAWMTVRSATKSHKKHPDRPLRYKPYRIQVGGTLMISAVTVLLTLIILLIVVPSNKWVMSRRIGLGLITIWAVSTAANVLIECFGIWADVS
ncbi:Sodium/calcium exchanger protein-domain-containing protein [Podospora appendiculata]|uniref:Sodium/calcium exchanger protein-domain-containing protein n=1 Tax=Podospora appendiculata TaxID=314037 RepID=A0AAE1CHW6_9PEZI|nr:Sodium/calcium exchanger protein-domain-containing protein [Podospora appendiculata]